MKRLRPLFVFLILLSPSVSGSQEPEKSWNLHGQLTVISQGHGEFNSPYSGTNSFQSRWELYSIGVGTVYLGKRLWSGGELFVNPELAAGRGLSDVEGIAGFPKVWLRE